MEQSFLIVFKTTESYNQSSGIFKLLLKKNATSNKRNVK